MEYVWSIIRHCADRKYMKDLNVATGRWWRWTHYEIRDGCIRPAPGARLRAYDPWRIWLKTRPLARRANQHKFRETPYQSLLGLPGALQHRQPQDEPLDINPE